MSDAQTPDDGPSTPPDDGPASPPAAGPGEPPSKDECNLAVLAHVLGIISGFVGALIIWLIKKEDSAFIDDQGKEALNFQITMNVLFIVLTVIPGLCLIAPLVLVVNLIFCIIAAAAAGKGQRYRYPFAVRLVS